MDQNSENSNHTKNVKINSSYLLYKLIICVRNAIEHAEKLLSDNTEETIDLFNSLREEYGFMNDDIESQTTFGSFDSSYFTSTNGPMNNGSLNRKYSSATSAASSVDLNGLANVNNMSSQYDYYLVKPPANFRYNKFMKENYENAFKNANAFERLESPSTYYNSKNTETFYSSSYPREYPSTTFGKSRSSLYGGHGFHSVPVHNCYRRLQSSSRETSFPSHVDDQESHCCDCLSTRNGTHQSQNQTSLLMKDIRKDYSALISLSENTLGMARDLLKTVTQFHRVDETDWMRWIDVLLGQISNTMGACTNTCFILCHVRTKIKFLLKLENANNINDEVNTKTSRSFDRVPQPSFERFYSPLRCQNCSKNFTEISDCTCRKQQRQHQSDKGNNALALQEALHASVDMVQIHHMAALFTKALSQVHR